MDQQRPLEAIRSYRDLAGWQRAMDLVEDVYQATRQWPRDEMYGLTNQVRRAVVSVPSNIAEGQGRRNAKEFVRFLSIARGSLSEVETQLLIGQRLGYLDERTVAVLLQQSAETGRILNGLIRSLLPRTDN